MVKFLQNFYQVFPEYERVDVGRSSFLLTKENRAHDACSCTQTYLAGESYAGQYIPYIGA